MKLTDATNNTFSSLVYSVKSIATKLPIKVVVASALLIGVTGGMVMDSFVFTAPSYAKTASKNKVSKTKKRVTAKKPVTTKKPVSVAPATRNGMTWKMVQSPLVLNSKTYVLFGSDNGQPGGTNPSQGDTNINEYRSLLCIKKTGAPAPAGLPPSVITPGGADKHSWSGGTVLVIPNIQGRQLT